MEKIGIWLTASSEHLQAHWRLHVLPAVLILVVTLVYTFAMIAGLAVSVGITAALEDGRFMIGVVALQAALLVLLMVVLQPLSFGHYQVTLRALRGESVSSHDVFGGYRHTLAALALVVLIAIPTCFGMLFCYVPGLLVGTFFLFALPAMADRGLGPLDAMEVSWDLVKPRFGVVLLYWFCLLMLVMVLAYIPIVGGALAVPVMTVAISVAYLDLTRPTAA